MYPDADIYIIESPIQAIKVVKKWEKTITIYLKAHKIDALKRIYVSGLGISVFVFKQWDKKVGKSNENIFKIPKNRGFNGEVPIRDQNHGV